MNPKISDILQRIRELEAELECELESRREALHVRFEHHRVRFEREIQLRHKRLKTGLFKYIRQAELRNVVTAPIIYSMIVPLAILDAFITLYQFACFPLYRIERVIRRDYMAFDRGQLAYLNIIEKFNCTYCSYANGLAAYVKEIIARTEQYWCPIRHARRLLETHSHYGQFVDYGDAEAYHRELDQLRQALKYSRTGTSEGIEMKRWLLWLVWIFPLELSAASAPPAALTLPPGFVIEVFAEVDNARQMALGQQTLFVGSRSAGKVYALPLRNNRADKPIVIAKNLNLPVGVAFRDGDLYVSAVDRILRLRDIEARLKNPPEPEVVTASFPTETHHGWKFIAFGPDGKLHVPVGAPCNICEADADRYAVITRLDIDTGKIETIARGVRNTVGFDWHPVTGELWFTDNGRDWMGDDAPPDELNRLEKPGQHFGYPYCHGGTLRDPEFGKRGCGEFTPPALKLGAHVAALGMRFYTGTMFPSEYRNAIFVAEHGSWNRSRKAGYRVMVAKLEGNRVVDYRPFVTGWLRQQQTLGRPADVLIMPDGSLLISDDHAGRIYRVSYQRKN